MTSGTSATFKGRQRVGRHAVVQGALWFAWSDGAVTLTFFHSSLCRISATFGMSGTRELVVSPFAVSGTGKFLIPVALVPGTSQTISLGPASTARFRSRRL